MGTVDRREILKEEQAAVTHVYECLDLQVSTAASHASPKRWGQDCPESGTSFIPDVPPELQRTAIDTGGGALVVMRVDVEDEAVAERETFYIGRRTVKDPADDRRLVINWSSPAAIRWQMAQPSDPGEVRLRRRLRCAGRIVTDYADDIVSAPSRPQETADETGPAPAPPASAPAETTAGSMEDFLLADLLRARDGRMRDIVETIQREQLALVANEHEGVLVVQGGPGTGKTAVGLHRVAWLLNPDNKRYTAAEVLVIGPHKGFLDYVGNVLPQLGVEKVRSIVLDKLWDEGSVTDSLEVRRIKSSERMAEVLRRAVHNTVDFDALNSYESGVFEVRRPGAVLRIPCSQIEEIVRQALDGPGTFRAQRQRAIDSIIDQLIAADHRISANVDNKIRGRLRSTSEVKSLMKKLWPERSSRQILKQLLTSKKVLDAAADQILTDDERELLIEAPNRAWSAEDHVCREEIEYLLTGEVPRRYRHVVIDEAQDLTPMQARSIARRCPSGSMTVLGDLTQATGPHTYASWQELAQILAAQRGWLLTELKIGYRVPGEVMDLVAPLAAHLSPNTAFPASFREKDGTSVTVIPSNPWQLVEDAVGQAISLGETDGDRPRSIALIVPDDDSCLDQVKRRIETTQVDGTESATGITVLPARLAKGLEFDHVVVLEPASIANLDHAGLHRLYVALTRCTQSLTLVHTSPLPAELSPEPDTPTTDHQDTAERQCNRFHANGKRCKHRTSEADGWCRIDGCEGFLRPTPVNRSPHYRTLHLAPDADLSAKLNLPADAHTSINVTWAARTQFTQLHGGDEQTAEAEIRNMLRVFLNTARHARQVDGYWLLDLEGYRLVLAPEGNAVTAYRSGHLDRTYFQFAAGVPSRVSRKDKAATRSAVGTRPRPGMPLDNPESIRNNDVSTLFFTARACESFDKLVPESRTLLADDFDAAIRERLSLDLQRSRLLMRDHDILLTGEEFIWSFSLDGRVVTSLQPLKWGDPSTDIHGSTANSTHILGDLTTLLGEWVEGRAGKEIAPHHFEFDPATPLPAPAVLVLRHGDPRPAPGAEVRAWVVRGNSDKLIVSRNPFGRLPVSDAMRERYAAALTAFEEVGDGGSVDIPERLSDLKGMANRCLRADQKDWLSVFELLGRPERPHLQTLARLAQFAREAYKSGNQAELTKILAELNASGWARQLPIAHKRLQAKYSHETEERNDVEVDLKPNAPAIDSTKIANEYLDLLKSEVAEDREDDLHERLRNELLVRLLRAGHSPDESSPIADIILRGPTETVVYEVLGVNGESFRCMRAGAMRLKEVVHALDSKVDSSVLVLPRPPVEEWAVSELSAIFNLTVIWRTPQGWSDQASPSSGRGVDGLAT